MTLSRRAAALLAALTLLLAALVSALAGAPAHARKAPAAAKRALPIVIAHRGASAYRPEHTLAAYRYAISVGADYIEPDLVSTKDHVLVARHENEISGTTDVASRPEFADRQTTKAIDGRPVTGWFTEDFTLAELRTLRAEERLPDLRPANTAFDGRYTIPTFAEVVALARRHNVGIYPETKHPTYFDSIGLSLEEPLVAELRRNRLNGRNARVFIQSFEVRNLRQLSQMTAVPLVQLLSASGRPFDFEAAGDPRTYADLITRSGLRSIARYADGIGPDKNLIIPRDEQGRWEPATRLVRNAHRAGLVVHPYTFRPENEFLPANLREGNPASPVYDQARGDQPTEIARFLRLGVDGLFADNPDTAVAVRTRLFGRVPRR